MQSFVNILCIHFPLKYRNNSKLGKTRQKKTAVLLVKTIWYIFRFNYFKFDTTTYYFSFEYERYI